MTQTPHGGGRPTVWWPPDPARAVLTALLMALVVALPVAARSGAPQASSDDQTRSVVAHGPFGSVPGLALPAAADLPDPALLEALDAYGRGASISIAPVAGSLDRWHVTASPEAAGDPAGHPAHSIELGSGDSADRATIRMPTSGLYLVRLDGVISDPAGGGAPDTTGSWVWRIAVPDRDVPGGGDPYPPVPAIILASGDQSIALDPGSGCFVGTCGDIGATSPPRTLPTLHTIAATAMTVTLSDVSGISAWSADATPVGAADDQTILLGSGTAVPAARTLMFAAPPAGRWVILVHVRFDRDRGSADGYGRLILGPNGP